MPINYLGDYAGGGMMLAFGMVSALLAVQRRGRGQVVDAAMSDGAALIGALTYGLRAAGLWQDEREANLLDGGSRTTASIAARTANSSRSARSNRSSSEALFKGLALRPGREPRGNRDRDQEPDAR